MYSKSSIRNISGLGMKELKIISYGDTKFDYWATATVRKYSNLV